MRRLGTIVVALLVAVAVSSFAGLAAGSAAPAPVGAKAERADAPGTHTIFLVNRTEETIWPAAWPGSTSGRTGWALPAGGGTSFTVPAGWNARLWGCTGCHRRVFVELRCIFSRGTRSDCSSSSARCHLPPNRRFLWRW